MTRRNRPLNQPEPVKDLPPDVVEQELWSLSEFAEKHWKTILGGLAAVSVVWGGLGIWQMISHSQSDAAAAQTAAVFTTAGALVQAPPEGDAPAPVPSSVKTFPSAAARAEAVLAAAKSAEGLGDTAKLVVAGAQADLGKWQEVLTAVDAALPSAAGSALELALLEQKATALAGLGKFAEASAVWQQVASKGTTAFAKANANIRVAEIAMREGKADAAKKALEAAVSAASPGGKDPEPGNLAFALASARDKLARL